MVPTPRALGRYLTIWPTAAPPNTPPNAVTLDDYPTGDIRNNAAIVPAGITNGSVSAITNAPTDLVIDINGYYAPSTGITLAQGTASAPSLSFSGDVTTGIFSSGTGSLNFTTGGTNQLTIRPDGDLDLAGNVRKGGTLLLHNIGTDTTAVGLGAMPNNTASGNTALGRLALASVTSGRDNLALGSGALYWNTTGGSNVAVGQQAMNTGITIFDNTGIGYQALLNLHGGSNNNTAIGFMAGLSLTGGVNNIYIGNPGMSSEDNTIRIGDSPLGPYNTYIQGIYGSSIASGAAVMVDSTGHLGTSSSSRRYKEDIADMGDASNDVFRLRPVTFRYKKPDPDGSKPIDFGLIAEEVAEIYPDLVVKNKDGQIETVQYQKLTPMLLNEVKKEHDELQKEQRERSETIQYLQAQVAALQKTVEILMADKEQSIRKTAER